jgi:hypothetical protein
VESFSESTFGTVIVSGSRGMTGGVIAGIAKRESSSSSGGMYTGTPW